VTRHAPPDTEVVVVDDASPAGVVTAAAGSFPAVRVVRLPDSGGFCAAANAGLEAATAPVVELLNDDTEVTAGWAEAALTHFRDAQVAAVAPLVLHWPGGGPGVARIDSAGDRYYLGGVAGKRGHGTVLGPLHLRPCRVFGASGSSAFYRRDVVLRVGAFPASFGAYFEDIDLAFRLHRAGHEIIFEPAARVLHHLGASHGRARGVLLEQQSRNEERVFWRNVPARDLPRTLPLHLAVLAAKAWRRWREGTLVPFLRGRLQVLGEARALVRHRRALAALGPPPSLRRWRVESRLWERRPIRALAGASGSCAPALSTWFKAR
jgi:GT2 family glycosyltransferase